MAIKNYANCIAVEKTQPEVIIPYGDYLLFEDVDDEQRPSIFIRVLRDEIRLYERRICTKKTNSFLVFYISRYKETMFYKGHCGTVLSFSHKDAFILCVRIFLAQHEVETFQELEEKFQIKAPSERNRHASGEEIFFWIKVKQYIQKDFKADTRELKELFDTLKRL